MAEIVGLTASIITLLDFVATGIKFCKKIRDAPLECINVQRELSLLQIYLQDFDRLLNGPYGTPEWAKTAMKLAEPGVGMLSRLESTLARMSNRVKKVTEGKKVMGIALKYRAIVWPFTASECRDVLNELRESKTLLSIVVQLGPVRLMIAIQEDLSAIKAQLGVLACGMDDMRLEMERARGRSYLCLQVDMHPGRWDALFGQNLEDIRQDNYVFSWFMAESWGTPLPDIEDQLEDSISNEISNRPVAYRKFNDAIYNGSYSNVPRTLGIYWHVLQTSGALPDRNIICAVVAEEQRYASRAGSKAQSLVRMIQLEGFRQWIDPSYAIPGEELCYELWEALDIPEVTYDYLLYLFFDFDHDAEERERIVASIEYVI
ncbi:hypothetical protein DL96DRAFT_1579375 [Flagelloscypha sp. PMI_526]|nr:hypothetical protein DL96DRAFT_1579375 [Flagelloscypha sp. PMI_526]